MNPPSIFEMVDIPASTEANSITRAPPQPDVLSIEENSITAISPQPDTEHITPTRLEQSEEVTTEPARHWWQARDLDVLEQELQARPASDSAASRLLRSFTKLKHQPSGTIFRSVLAFQKASATGTSPRQQNILDVTDDASFTTCLDTLRVVLRDGGDSGLQICYLINISLEGFQLSAHSFVSKLFSSTKALGSVSDTPFLAILHVLQREWELNPGTLSSTFQADLELNDVFSISVPSKLKTEPLFLSNSNAWAQIDLVWYKYVTPYSSDVNVYIWEPHLESPTTVGVSIFISPISSNYQRILVLLKRSDTRYIVDSLAHMVEEIHSHVPETLKGVVSMEMETIVIYLSICSYLISDTTALVRRLFNATEDLSKQGRRSPSVSKNHYTLYLEECQSSSLKAMSTAIWVLSTISITFEVPQEQQDHKCELIKWIDTVKEDLEYLQLKLKDVESKLLGLRQSIKDQLDLRQIRLTRILTILAAIFLPFSFVSSFFGMNVHDPLWPKDTHKFGKSPKSNSATHDVRRESTTSSIMPATASSSISQAQTDALIAAISSSGPHLFTFPTFLVVAFTVTVATIALPLVAGSIFRTILRSVYKYRGHWRVVVFVGVLATAVTTRVLLPISVEYVYLLIFGIPQGILVAGLLVRKQLPLRKRWIVYISLLSLSVYTDLQSLDYQSPRADDADQSAVNYGTSSTSSRTFIGITGIVPLYYLLLLDANNEIKVSVRRMISQDKFHWYSSLRRRAIKNQKHAAWSITLFWTVINVSIYTLSPSTVQALYLVGMGIATSLYGAGKIVEAFRIKENRRKWICFMVIVSSSIVVDVIILSGILTATMPFGYLVAYPLVSNDQELVAVYYLGWMNWRKPRVLSSSTV